MKKKDLEKCKRMLKKFEPVMKTIDNLEIIYSQKYETYLVVDYDCIREDITWAKYIKEPVELYNRIILEHRIRYEQRVMKKMKTCTCEDEKTVEKLGETFEENLKKEIPLESI